MNFQRSGCRGQARARMGHLDTRRGFHTAPAPSVSRPVLSEVEGGEIFATPLTLGQASGIWGLKLESPSCFPAKAGIQLICVWGSSSIWAPAWGPIKVRL